MKNIIKTIVSTTLLFTTASSVSAQNAEASLNSEMPKVTAKVEAPPPSIVGKEVVIAFINTAEKPVAIFAGPKENIRKPRIETYGGLSKNQKFYMRENEVVCLMSADNTPKACTIIKPGVTTVEVNSSATLISSK